MQSFRLSRTEYTKFHLAAFFALKSLHGLAVGYFFPHESRVVHLNYSVTRHKSHFFRRSSRYHAVHVYRIVLYSELYAYTAEVSLQFRVHFLQILGRDIRRVWVQFRKNQRHGFFYHVFHIHCIHIRVVDYSQQSVNLV